MDTHPPDRAFDDATSGSTTGRRTTRRPDTIEIFTHDARRDWPAEVKRSIVMESFTGELTPSELARKHAITTGQLYTWRREFLAAYAAAQAAQPVTQFARVDVEPLPSVKRSAPPAPAKTTATRQAKGTIEVSLANGAMIRVDGQVDSETLRQVLQALSGE
jgi:transposase